MHDSIEVPEKEPRRARLNPTLRANVIPKRLPLCKPLGVLMHKAKLDAIKVPAHNDAAKAISISICYKPPSLRPQFILKLINSAKSEPGLNKTKKLQLVIVDPVLNRSLFSKAIEAPYIPAT
ncbi:hypothetical protein OIU85_021986 [Salix viminalis]|uniref:Uncharacterized protein n=1 Tax=Salix viminalis TaxID=40686 RepID=A0A9Q0ZE84_SALVM|nr:hypothetical protein OIU85_021986 [Salix viminalis]